jgi:2-C-methyl-D-erythritol 4-phosphate cytidylyltransferase
MQVSVPKQYLVIAGKPILQHSVNALLSVAAVQHAVVALADNDDQWTQLEAAQDDRVSTVVGGATRADSVMAGLSKVVKTAGESAWVLVHDAARPLVASEDIENLIEQVASTGSDGGLLASKVQDTLKRCADETTHLVTQTVDRRKLWQAQTPQLFRAGDLLGAYIEQLVNAESPTDAPVTDEASAMELAGFKPLLVEAQHQNFKITRNSDAKFAEVLMLDRLSSNE